MLAFYLNHLKKYRRATYVYNGLNLVGALLLTYYAFSINATVVIVLNTIWILIAAYFLLKIKRG